jgi:hypothetical protein
MPRLHFYVVPIVDPNGNILDGEYFLYADVSPPWCDHFFSRTTSDCTSIFRAVSMTERVRLAELIHQKFIFITQFGFHKWDDIDKLFHQRLRVFKDLPAAHAKYAAFQRWKDQVRRDWKAVHTEILCMPGGLEYKKAIKRLRNL